ncbi:MAG: hypothetical protein ACSHXZ_03680 [Gammaproteobacteria bacterium]
MTLRVLEFNDAGLRLSDDTGVVLSSPGYALVLPQSVEFGESARAQSRLNPLNSHNQFWHKLSVEPFSKPLGHYRHNADIAFSHIQHFAEQAQIKGDVLLALPGSFSRQQMAILLGLMKQSSLNAVGIVDAGLAATIDRHQGQSILHAELELHQVVLSKLRKVGKNWKREAVLLVPSAGWVNISDNLMQLFTTAFIQQCRFNPEHNAASEQMLLDALPGYLREGIDDKEHGESQRSLQISLRHNDNVHEVSLPRSSVHGRLDAFYAKIQQQLSSLDGAEQSPLFISDRLGQLPQVREVFARNGEQRREVKVLPDDAVTTACFRHREALISATEAVRFVSELESKQQAITPLATGVRVQATHLLFGHIALPLREGLLVCRMDTRGAGEPSLEILEGANAELPEGAALIAQLLYQSGLYFVTDANAVQINGQDIREPHTLSLGDSVQFSSLSQSIELIAVQEHNV